MSACNAESTEEITELEKEKEKLKANIWLTRKNRICASERLLRSANYVEFINVYYSIVVILFSLLGVSPFLKNRADEISYMSIAGSVALTISIIFANSLKYRQRALDLKKNYIDLQFLLAELSTLNIDNREKFLEMEKKYVSLLDIVENHQPIDFVNVIRQNKISEHPMSGVNWTYYVLYNIWHWFWKILLVLLPAIGLIFLLR